MERSRDYSNNTNTKQLEFSRFIAILTYAFASTNPSARAIFFLLRDADRALFPLKVSRHPSSRASDDDPSSVIRRRSKGANQPVDRFGRQFAFHETRLYSRSRLSLPVAPVSRRHSHGCFGISRTAMGILRSGVFSVPMSRSPRPYGKHSARPSKRACTPRRIRGSPEPKITAA